VKKIFLLVLILILGLLQATILNYFRLFWVKPDLLLICVVIAGLFFSPVAAIGFSIFIGVYKDILGFHNFGLNSLLFPIWGFLTIQLGRKISLDNDFIRAGFIFFLAGLNGAAVKMISDIPVSAGIFFKVLILEPFYTAIVSLLILRFICPAFEDNQPF
jgi:rod shape-determining protein MreD